MLKKYPNMTLLVAMALMTSGCLGGETNGKDGEIDYVDDIEGNEKNDDSKISQKEGENNTVAPAYKPGMEWTDCLAFAATATGPAAIYPYPPEPPGWDGPGIPGFNQHYLHAAYCERVQWGPYERGPVFTLFELTSGFLGPESCVEGEYNRYSHLGTLWISDPEIAAYANKTLGIPVHVAEYELEDLVVGGLLQRTWQWGLKGQPKSELTMSELDGESYASTFGERIFWMNGTTISYLDLRQNYEVPTFQQYAAYGRMETPMVAASSGIHEYATGVDANINTDWRGTVRTFRDYACTEPI